MDNGVRNINDKVKSLPEILKIIKKINGKKKIVFTNGCFDLLHIGHARYLMEARKLGDFLIVGVNSDNSVQALKGEGRPIISEDDRVEMLASLEMVDYIILFNERTAASLLESIKPDVYVKGGDYTQDTLPEWPIVKEYGGRVELIPEIQGRSTSNIITKIRGS